MTATHWAKLAAAGVEMRPRDTYDFYPTDIEHVRAGLELLPQTPQSILDAGMGSGVWGIEARKMFPNAEIVGVEMRLDAPFMAAYDWNIRANYLLMDTYPIFDTVIGNPPYKYAEQFIRQSFDNLRLGGYMVQLLRLSFLESLSRYQFFTNEFPPLKVVVCSDRPSFTGDGKTDSSAYAFFVWQKGHLGGTGLEWTISRPANKKHEIRQLEMFQDTP